MKMIRKRTEVKSTARGKLLEQQILSAAAKLEAEQLLVLRKVDPPTRMVKGKGGWKVVRTASPFLDFVGVHSVTGQAVFIEAKTISNGHRLELGEGGLTAAQISALAIWSAARARVGVIVKLVGKFESTFWWLSGTEVFRATLHTQKSIAVVERGVPLLVDEDGDPIIYHHLRGVVVPDEST